MLVAINASPHYKDAGCVGYDTYTVVGVGV